ncbi:MAG: hypothetical protein ACRC6V_02965 [Bacteroidales bacterium]
MRKIVTSILATSCLVINAQSHVHGQNEIGISFGPNYSTQHKEWRAGAHMHYFRGLTPHSRWKLGGGLEYIFGGGKHYNVSLGASYSPFRHFHVTLMPGVNFINEDDHDHGEIVMDDHESDDLKVGFALHGEVVYDLVVIGKFHLGPTIDFSWSKNHSHFMAGIHTAYSF